METTVRRRRIRHAVLVGVAAGLIGAVSWWTWSQRLPTTGAIALDRAPLARAAGRAPRLSVRLSGFLSEPRPSGVPAVRASSELLVAIADIETRFRQDDSATNEALLGTARLTMGDVAGAAALFDTAVTRLSTTSNAELWNDAAAAYLTAATDLGWDEMWVRGLDAAERARSIDATAPEAAFNRAVALEGLRLHSEARAAWQDYLAMDSQSAWSSEARRRLEALNSVSDGWPAFRSQLSSQLPAVESGAAIAAKFRGELRTWIEQELMPEWANHVVAGRPEAASAYARTRAAAELLLRAGGDRAPAEALRAVERLGGSHADARRALAEAYIALVQAGHASDRGDYVAAAEAISAAEPTLRAYRSPYAAYAPLYAAITRYMARDLGGARRLLQNVATSAPTYVAGLRDWMNGLIDLNENQLHRARAQYRAALENFDTLGEREAVARVSALLAEAQAALGNAREAWRHQRVALDALPFVNVPRRVHVILQVGGLMCLRDELPLAALAFHNAVIGAAGDHTPSLIGGHLQRARTEARLGRPARAAADLDTARRLLADVPAELLRRTLEADVEEAAAEVELPRPELALAAASRALTHFGGPRDEFRSSGLFFRRGRAYMAKGDVARARSDLSIAIDRFELLRERVSDRVERMRLFRDGWSAYSEMVKLAVASRDEQGALEFAERARARTLVEALMGQSATPEPANSVAAALPRDAAVLFYTTQADQLWLWLITRDRIQFIQKPLAIADLRARIGRVERLLTHQTQGNPHDDAALRQTLQSLFTDLIGSAKPLLLEARTLVVVPDGPLHGLPFAALIDPATREYLVERYTIAVTPSLTILRRSTGALRPKAPNALIVGDPALQEHEPRFAALPFARAEAESVANVYPASTLLLQSAATRTAFLTKMLDADVIHYAGHAFVNAQEPDRSAMLLAPDRPGASGAVLVSDFRPSMLPRHPLVVLAACSTSKGRLEIGEGNLSLARAFLEAGARNVVATLWDVPDSFSAALFRGFHRKVASGLPAAEALARVQRELLTHTDANERAPSRWAWAVAIGGGIDHEASKAVGGRNQ